MKSNLPITLIETNGTSTGCYTYWPVIAVQLESVELFDAIPPVVTIRDSKYYGHRIYMDYVDGNQWLELSDAPDEKWLSENPR
jgi:hypothetical protein